MADLQQWLKDNLGRDYTGAGTSWLIFVPPPGREECHATAIFANDEQGRAIAKRFAGYGWATHLLKGRSSIADAIHWLQWLGYGRDEHGRPILRLPRGAREFGASKIDLVRVVECIIRNPDIASRELADELSKSHGRKIGRQAANRAMMAVKWGPEEREAYKSGATGAPRLAR